MTETYAEQVIRDVAEPGTRFVVGVDEVGCGAIAGPLVVAAVAFPVGAQRVQTTWRGVRGNKTLVVGDSKKVKLPEQREALDVAIRAACSSQATIVRSPAEIDARLLREVFPEAVRLAISRCLERLTIVAPGVSPSEVMILVDGDLVQPDTPCRIRMVPGGDAMDWRIGAASVVAKAQHDVQIRRLAADFPDWGFEAHRGYPTRDHKNKLDSMGLIDNVHRKTFKPVRASRGPIPGFEE